MKHGLAMLSVAAVMLSTAMFTARAANGSAASNAPEIARGRTVFVAKGCYACHGYNGQGGVTGPKLAPEPMDLEALKSFIRNAGSTSMPAYSAHLVSDTEAADIHAWLASQAKPKDPAQIPLLAR